MTRPCPSPPKAAAPGVAAAGLSVWWRVPAALRRLGRRGVAAVEFAFCAPLLLLLLLGCVDLMTALRAQLRIETAAVQLGQIVSQCIRINAPGDTNNFFAHGQQMVGSLGRVTGASLGAQGSIVITAVRNNGANPGANVVAWQIRDGSTASEYFSTVFVPGRATNSVTRNAGEAATIDNNFIVPREQTLIVTEIFLARSALLLRGGFTLPETLRANTLFLSRSPDAVVVQTLVSPDNNTNCTA